MDDGRYLVKIKIDGMDYPVPGELRVISARNPQLEKLVPNIVYPAGGLFTFTLTGQNLGVERKDISLEIQGSGPVDLDRHAKMRGQQARRQTLHRTQ